MASLTRSCFACALRTTLIKRAGDIQPFEELFDFFFLGIGQAIDALDRRIMEELGLSPQQFQEMLEQIQKFLREMEGDLSELTKALLVGEPRRAGALASRSGRTGIGRAATPKVFATRRLRAWRAACRWTGCSRRSNVSKACCRCSAENGEDLQNVMRYLDERMRDLHRLLREIIQQEQRKQGHGTARL